MVYVSVWLMHLAYGTPAPLDLEGGMKEFVITMTVFTMPFEILGMAWVVKEMVDALKEKLRNGGK